MNLFRSLLAVAVVGLAALSTNSANAQCFGDGGCGFGYGDCINGNAWGWGWGWSGTNTNSLYHRPLPYFSAHPPVYYSHPYYRPYGWTPYAQPSYHAPVALQPEPRLVVNPHVPAAKVKAAKPKANEAGEKSAQRSAYIVNPFYVQGKATGQGQLATSHP